jgi:hypothetical protein
MSLSHATHASNLMREMIVKALIHAGMLAGITRRIRLLMDL